MTAKINKCWKQLNCLQPDVQEGGRRPVQEQTQQWADDVSHEGQSESFFVSADILNPFKWRSVFSTIHTIKEECYMVDAIKEMQ